ncbi:VOC family protein [Rheinheimera hassiensis]|uniref:VOC family protein n=1 Tax=Rheinheimera hassiensis TaxID=1193627 RepID=UPI001F058E8F|nr:VOC family protein [Rheinheimera hassiensis]
MKAPAKHGALVYSNDIKNLAKFYKELFAMEVIRETTELISLVKDGFNIVIHTPPATMPQPDFNSVKLFLTVDNIEEAKLKAKELGGRLFEGLWSNPLFSVCNIADSDGNHIQLRQFR